MSIKRPRRNIARIIGEEILAAAKPAPPAPPQLVNHIVLLLDESASMGNCFGEAVRQLNKNIATIRENAKKSDQKTTVSFYSFGRGRGRVILHYFQEPVERLVELNQHDFNLGDATPLRDAFCTAVADAWRADKNNDNVSYLLVCATDGGENSSTQYKFEAFRETVVKAQATDRWTIAFMVPRGSSRRELEGFGVPTGNITEWENTRQGAEVAFNANNASFDSYYASRSMGQKAVKNFYTTDLSTVTAKTLAKLDDVSGNFKAWTIDKETDIKEFVERHGVKFFLGAGFYQVTKKELLRAGRNVLLQEKGSNRIYGGQQARDILGLPAGETHITPGNHANYGIYFQSTSVNRKLVRGTKLLYDLLRHANAQETWDSAAAQAAADLKKALQQPTV